MKTLAINGSPRNQKTAYMLRKLLEKCTSEHKTINLIEYKINPCLSCRKCTEAPFVCPQEDDMTKLKEELKKADIFIFGSPIYFDNMTGTMKNFFDRCLGLYHSKELADKKAILLTIGGGDRPSSAERTLNSMQYFCDLLNIKTIARFSALRGEEKSIDQDLENFWQSYS